jgi:hypothetical protein
MAISTRMPAGAAITVQLVAALCVLAPPTTSSTMARTVSNQLLARIWACSSQEVIPIWIPFINDRSIIKVLDTKFPYRFTRSEIVLISIGEGAGGGGGRKGGIPQNLLESEHYLAIPSERAGFTRRPHGKGNPGNIAMFIF